MVSQTAVASRIDRADNSKFLEQFRYTIVASQLLSGHTITDQGRGPSTLPRSNAQGGVANGLLDPTGAMSAVLGALAVALVISWLYGSGGKLTKKRLLVVLILGGMAAGVAQVLMRRQWLRYRRHQALAEVSAFVSNTQEFDGVTGAAIALIQEVELVSRGYRM